VRNKEIPGPQTFSKKERLAKEDGRYIIFYSFDRPESGGGPQAGSEGSGGLGDDRGGEEEGR
jgi:hypothetical protein